MSVARLASFKTAAEFQNHLQTLEIPLPFEEHLEQGTVSPLGQSFVRRHDTIGNRFCILPMEGWDGSTDGMPSDLTRRRLAEFWTEWSQVDLGRRSSRRPP